MRFHRPTVAGGVVTAQEDPQQGEAYAEETIDIQWASPVVIESFQKEGRGNECSGHRDSEDCVQDAVEQGYLPPWQPLVDQ